jgi:prepilin peptidase dependent protein B
MPIKATRSFAKQRGMSLIEIMISLVISIILLGGLLSLYMAFNKSSFDLIRNIKLEQEIRATINFMAKDIKRAGFINDAHNNIGSAGYCSPSYFNDCVTKTPLFIIPVTNDSISFSYDANADGTPENYSFSLSNNEITYLYPGSGGAAVPVTSSGTTIFTALAFALSSDTVQITTTDTSTTPPTTTVESQLKIRAVTITATAYANGDDPLYARTVTKIVRIRNDEYSAL